MPHLLHTDHAFLVNQRCGCRDCRKNNVGVEERLIEFIHAIGRTAPLGCHTFCFGDRAVGKRKVLHTALT